MTWNELKPLIERMSPEQQQTDVTIYVSAIDETYVATTLAEVPYGPIKNSLCGGVLDDGHPFLVTV